MKNLFDNADEQQNAFESGSGETMKFEVGRPQELRTAYMTTPAAFRRAGVWCCTRRR